MIQIGVLIGSLRRESITLKMAKALISLAPDSLSMKVIEIGNLSIYNEDLETEIPPYEWRMFRDEIRCVEGVLFVTPEYNRSVPAVLKNAIDIGSAPHGHNVFKGKSGAIVSVSPGMMGAFGANHHLRQSLVFLDMPTMQQPEAYIGGSERLFDDNGEIVNESMRKYLSKFMEAFDDWVKRHC